MPPAQVKPTISPELLNQIDVRVGTIEAVSEVANSERLVALRVNFGDHVRTILAGMKRERANPREIEGKQALFDYSLSTFRRAKWQGWFRKECYSISGTLTGSPRSWGCRSRECLTEPEQGDMTDVPATMVRRWGLSGKPPSVLQSGPQGIRHRGSLQGLRQNVLVARLG